MNYFDVIVIIPLIWFAYKGFSKGFVRELASLAALILGLYGGVKLSGLVSDFLLNSFNWNSKYLTIVSFALTFIIIVILVHFVAKLVDKLVKAVSLNFFNKIAGALFGVAKVILIISVLIVIFNKIDDKSDFITDEFKEGSLLYNPISNISYALYAELENL